MRPLLLKLNAFGTYLEETIDFTFYDQNEIFLICGDTGAGKTTIFDAICYALYGKASGESRQNENFKSAYADDDALCCVEFEFLLKLKVYKIKRIPKQTRINRKGKVTDDRPSSVELTMPDGNIVLGKSADEKIKEIMGVDEKQFKKIFMLPQGEFKKLLDATGKERQELFSKIFNTGIYNLVEQELKNETASLKRIINEADIQNKIFISGIIPDESENLKAAITPGNFDILNIISELSFCVNEDREKLNAVLNTTNTLEEKKKKLNPEYAAEINAKFSKLDEQKKLLEALDSKKDEYGNLKALYNKLILVKELISDYLSLEKIKNEYDLTNKFLEESNENIIKIEKSLSDAIEELHQSKCLEPEIRNLEGKITLLDQKVKIFEEIESVKSHIKANETEAVKLDVEKNRYMLAKERFLLLDEYTNKMNIAGLFDKLIIELKKYKVSEKNLRIFTDEYSIAFKKFLNGQAGILASGLKENEECPVCGSLKHPKPAKKEVSFSDQELNKEKDKYETALDLYNNIKKSCGVCLARLHDKEYLLNLHEENLIAEKDEIIKEASKCKEALESIKTELDKKTDEIKFTMGEKGQKALNTEKYWTKEYFETRGADIENKIAVLAHDTCSNNERLNKLKSEIEDEFKNYDDLIIKKEVYQKRQSEIMNEIEEKNKVYLKIKMQKDKLEEQIKYHEDLLEKLRNQILENEQKLIDKEKNANINASEEYLSLEKDICQVGNIEKKINEYERERDLAVKLVRSLEKELENKFIYDLTQINTELESINTELSELIEERLKLEKRIDKNEYALENLIKNQENTKPIMERYNTFNELCRLIEGQNPQKISFERYILASYFNDVINYANQRLDKMTASRYRLERDRDRRKGGGASGLDFNVFDFHTGKSRPVSTLSGGEGFIASLALALGFSDVVSQNAGGVQIGAMFVDEGFGALDTESMDKAVSCLNTLRKSGILIGIISHVTELKERIPSKLMVQKGQKGSIVKTIK